MVANILLFLSYLIRTSTSQKFDVCESPRIDAMIWTHKHNKVILFVDRYFWEYDTMNRKLSKQSFITRYWSNIQPPIDSALTAFDENGTLSTYLIKDNKIWWYTNNGTNVLRAKHKTTGKVSDDVNVSPVTIVSGFDSEKAGNQAVVCDKSGEHIYFCFANAVIANLFLGNCTAPSARNLPEGRCTALARNSNSTYLIAGRKTIIQSKIGTVQADIEFEINEIFGCSTVKHLLFIIFVIGIVTLVIFNVALLVFTIYRKRKERLLELEKQNEESTVMDETKSTSQTKQRVDIDKESGSKRRRR
ncbi:hypothetical protein B4U80_13228 [Leptotrombidium deliense]|uniref:Uncharacterized protein n=1 Tax=Leptotrombidium deliense TaxID=299467 RepID=A0A443SA50_9ACAR|nr:hypothetical protein B4U80_13228 [Leptotrombidium deliense]